MEFSQKGLTLLKILEGCKLKAYRDSVGVLTIGYGTTHNVTEGQAITQGQADVLLFSYLINQDKELDKLIKVALNQNQYDALVIFTYNIGVEAFEKSTLLELINHNDFIKASNEFIKWAHPVELTKRRTIEKNLFMQK